MHPQQLLSTLALTATLASAHFQLLYPPQGTEFSDELEATGPCGTNEPVTVNDGTADVPVDQFAISVRSSHPEGTWAFRGTNSTAAPYNFTDITPLINTQGVGDFCLTSFSVPSEWAGSSGIIQVVDIADDGRLYQCTAVKFVEGANTTVGSACTNSSAFTASYAASGSSESGSPSGTASAPASSGASATGDAAASSSSPDAAAMATGIGALAGLGMVVAGLAL